MSGNINFDGWINDDGSENYKCRAWVNFNGTGTVAIRASGNVSSITDNGTGDYTVNFTNAMPDANYSCSFMGQGLSSNGWWRTGQPGASSVNGFTTGALRFQTPNSSWAATDTDIATLTIFR
jgi:hypothetical protein